MCKCDRKTFYARCLFYLALPSPHTIWCAFVQCVEYGNVVQWVFKMDVIILQTTAPIQMHSARHKYEESQQRKITNFDRLLAENTWKTKKRMTVSTTNQQMGKIYYWMENGLPIPVAIYNNLRGDNKNLGNEKYNTHKYEIAVATFSQFGNIL